MYILIIIILLSIITGLIIFYNKKFYKIGELLRKNIQQQVEEEFNNKRQNELEEELLIEFAKRREIANLEHKELLRDLENSRAQVRYEAQIINDQINQLKIRKEEQTKAIEETISDKKKIVETEVEAFRTTEIQKARTAIENEASSQQKWVDAVLAGYWEHLAQTTHEKEQELAQVATSLEDYRKKQQVINEAILRQREIDERQDFYRVALSEYTIEDIKLLQEIRQKLHTSDSLNKLIYDVYVSKSVQEMTKRVLQGGAPSGIYKITRLKTGEIYIGKSTNVKDRWVQHCKTVYGAGTIAHSILHTTMAKDGLEQFTFELIEEVPKEKLTEREKYWINFYGSKEYGLNERNG